MILLSLQTFLKAGPRLASPEWPIWPLSQGPPSLRSKVCYGQRPYAALDLKSNTWFCNVQ